MKLADAVVGNTYKVRKTPDSQIYYKKYGGQGPWLNGTNNNRWTYNYVDPPQGSGCIKPERGDYLECIDKDDTNRTSTYRLYRNNIATDTTIKTSRHGWIDKSDAILPGVAGQGTNLEGKARENEAKRVQAQIDQVTKDIDSKRKIIDQLMGKRAKLNARYRLLTEFDSNEAAIAHVLTEMKDEDPTAIVERLKTAGVEIIV